MRSVVICAIRWRFLNADCMVKNLVHLEEMLNMLNTGKGKESEGYLFNDVNWVEFHLIMPS